MIAKLKTKTQEMDGLYNRMDTKKTVIWTEILNRGIFSELVEKCQTWGNVKLYLKDLNLFSKCSRMNEREEIIK